MTDFYVGDLTGIVRIKQADLDCLYDIQDAAWAVVKNDGSDAVDLVSKDLRQSLDALRIVFDKHF